MSEANTTNAFTDTAGRTWITRVDVAAVRRVRSLCKVDLLSVVEDGCKLLAKLADDPVCLCEVLHAVCKPEADKVGVDEADFLAALSGDVLDAGLNALLAGLVDFFPDRRKREGITRLIEKVRQAQERLLIEMQKRVEAIDAVAAAVTLIGPSGSSPASSASTPPN